MSEIKFSDPQNYILTTTQRLNFFLSGIGAGKSFLIGVISAFFTTNFPESVGLIAANSHNQLNTSTLVQVFEAWEKVMGWEDGVDYVVGVIPPPHFKRLRKFKNYGSVISFPNGAIIFTASLERYKLLDGKNLTYALIDEIKDANPLAIKEVILPRLRQGGIYIDEVTGQLTPDEWSDEWDTPTQREPFAPLYLFSSPSRSQWLNEMFELTKFEDEINALTYDKNDFFRKEYDDKCVVISSSYHNTHLPKGFVDNQVKTMNDGMSKMLIFANPFISVGGEYLPYWKRKHHVRPCPSIDGSPLHIAFDFNVRPYVTMLVAQTRTEGRKLIIEIIAEVLGRPPRNRTAEVCKTFERKFGTRAGKDGLFYYGDASGKNADTRGDVNDYDIIDKNLRKYLNNKSRRVPASNPSILNRRDFINNILDERYVDEVEFFVDPSCVELIKDIENLKEGADGKKDKKKVKDEESGMMIEKYGHLVDALEYLLIEINKRLFMRHFK